MPRLIGVRARFGRRTGVEALLCTIAGLSLAGSLAGCGIVGGCEGLVFGAPCTHGPTGAPGGLSQDAAIAAAKRLAPAGSTPSTLAWAHIDNDPFAPTGNGDRRLVWEVRLQGSLAASPCPLGFLDKVASPTDKACLDGEGGLIAVLDYFSGAFVGWLH